MKCLLACYFLFFFCSADASRPDPDPCRSHYEENVWQRSTRHKMNARDFSRCDTRLTVDWYRFTSRAGGKIPHRRIQPGYCGTRRPIYISSGTLPTTKGKEVSLRACYDDDDAVCFDTISIKARLCQIDGKEYYIYYLKRPTFCASYCAGSEIPCPEGESSPTGFTINGKCNKLFPQFSTPRVHYVVKSNLLHFVCNFTTDATAVSDIFKITWHDSSHKTWKIEGTGSDFKQKMVINWSKLEKNGGMKLGDTFFCTIQSWYQHSPHNTSKISMSNHFFAGIRVRNRTIHIHVKEGELNDVILVEATIPILCQNPKSQTCAAKVFMSNEKVIASDECYLPFRYKTSPQQKIIYIAVPERQADRPTEHSFIALTVKNLKAKESWKNHKEIQDIQVITSDRKWGICHSTGDPHITTFGSMYYHLYQVGDYQMVRTSNHIFEVHVRTFQCAAVTCNCGVAAREGEDIVVIDMCGDNIPRPRLPRKEEIQRSDGTVITVDPSGRLFTISFSSGASIKFDTIKWYGHFYFGNMKIKIPPSYYGKTDGLCGTYDDKTGNELTSKDGKVLDKMLPPHRIAQAEFTDSWRLTTRESLFYYKPKDQKCKIRQREKKYCKCGNVPNEESNKVTCGTLGEAETFSANQKPLIFENEDFCSRRKRRSVHRSGDFITIPEDDGSGDYVYDPTPINITIPVWPTKTGKTQADVQKYCSDTIMNSQTGKMCKKLESFDFSRTIDQCVEDIKIADDFALVNSAIQSLAEMCKDDFISNVTYWSSDASGNGTLSPPAELFAISCPGLCSGKGTCVNGTCECFKGFSAPDCSINITTGPTFRYIQNNGFCDIRKRSDCSRIRVIGTDFIASKNLSCRITPFEMFNHSDSKKNKQIFTKATLLSFGEMTCDMMDNPVKSYTLSIKGSPYVRFRVEVSNDGRIFSKQSHNYTIYDSKCINCTNNGTCQFQESKCLINGYCFNDGESPPFSPCLRCAPKYNVTVFSPVKTGFCATTTTASSTNTTVTTKTTPFRSSTGGVSGNRTTTERPSITSEKLNVTTIYTNSITKESVKGTATNIPSTSSEKLRVTTKNKTRTKAHSKNETLKTTVSTKAKIKGKMATIISCSAVGGILVLVFLIVCALKFKKAHTIKTYPVDPAELSNNIELQRAEDLPLPH